MSIKANQIDHPFVFAVISGKGGVGKSMTSINTAATLNKLGYKVAVIDADLGLSNCATMLNENVQASVSQWINGDIQLENVAQNCSGITLVTAADEPGTITFTTEVYMDALDQVTEYLKKDHDFIIIDTPAGAREIGMWALDTADVGALVLVDEPSAISDAYRLCKYVFSMDPSYRFASIVNFAESETTADSIYHRFSTILMYFLEQQVEYLGFVPSSELITEAIKKQDALVNLHPDSPEAKEFEYIAQRVISYANNAAEPVLGPII